jgi:hypothetical protein
MLLYVITGFYALIIIGLIVSVLTDDKDGVRDGFHDSTEV